MSPSEPVHRPIRFVHRGAVVEVRDAPTTQSVLYWLRESARRVGTKEGCNEGDCGACMVIVASLRRRRARRRRAAADQRLPAVRRGARRQGAGHGRGPGVARGPASGAARDGRVPRLAVRLLHAGLHDVARGLLRRRTREPAPARSPAARRRAVGQPVPLHRLSTDRRRRRGDVRSTAGADRPRGAAHRARTPRRRSAAPLSRGRVGAGGARTARRRGSPRRARSTTSRRCTPRHPDARLVAGATDVGLWVTKQFRAAAAR